MTADFIVGSLYIKIQNLVMLKVEKVRDECENGDKCKIGYIHWCILMGEMRSMTRVILLYGLDPTPDLDGKVNSHLVAPVKEGAKQFLHQYHDAMQRQDSKTNPSDSIQLMYRQIQRATKYTVDVYDKEGNVVQQRDIHNARLSTTKEPSTNLRIDVSTGKLNVGALGLFYNSYAAKVCHDKLNSTDEDSRVITGRYVGLKGGATLNKGAWIQFEGKKWDFTSFDQPDINEPSNLLAAAQMIFCSKVRKTLDDDAANDAILEATEIRNRAHERCKTSESVQLRKRKCGKKPRNQKKSTWKSLISIF